MSNNWNGILTKNTICLRINLDTINHIMYPNTTINLWSLTQSIRIRTEKAIREKEILGNPELSTTDAEKN